MNRRIVDGLAVDAYGLHHAIVQLGGAGAPGMLLRSLNAKLRRLERLGVRVECDDEGTYPVPRVFDRAGDLIPYVTGRALSEDYIESALNLRRDGTAVRHPAADF